MIARQKNKYYLLPVIAILLSSLVGSIKAPALAQSQQPSLRLVDLAKFYSGLPHQERALQLLQQQVNTLNPELLSADNIAANVWRNSATLAGHTDILGQIPAANQTGPDPLQLALSAAAPRTGTPLDIEVLPSGGVEAPNQVMITVTKGGALDDSVAGVRDRFDIQLQNGQWQIQRAGRQVRCQAGRGHQNFSAENCL
ncbi:MAG: hypothetical protein AAFP03_04850 [Cyanobacteria bacterium J06598_3]